MRNKIRITIIIVLYFIFAAYVLTISNNKVLKPRKNKIYKICIENTYYWKNDSESIFTVMYKNGKPVICGEKE